MHPVTSNLISASAGTGKTYQLASRFMALLALGYPAEKLIALTFTRNAAAEFRGRILSDLASGASDDAKAAELAQRIRRTLRAEGGAGVPLCAQAADALPLDRGVFLQLLQNVVASLPKLNLSTMDSFFSKLVNSHSFELGHSSIEQMDEAELTDVRRKALYSLLVECSAEEEHALIDLCRDVLGDSKSGSFELLEDHIARYYALYQDTEDEAELVWGNPRAFGFQDSGMLQVMDELMQGASPEEIRLRLADFLSRCEPPIQAMAEAAGKSLKAFVRKGLVAMVEKLREGKDTTPKTLEWLYDPCVAEEADLAELQRLARRVREVALLLPAVLKTRGIMRLMKRYDAKYKADVQSAGKFVFDDMPRKVAALLDTRNPANIAYRLDGRLDHWMLDEFQDTSPSQWRALNPLLEEIRNAIYDDPAEENKQAPRSLFVVGDEKQSIYAWRGATPKLFSYLRTSAYWNRALQVSALHESQRSADAIMGASRTEQPAGAAAPVRMGFVNDLFRGIFEHDAAKLEEFTHHCIAQRHRDMRGYVRVQTTTQSEDDQLASVPVLESMCRDIMQVLRQEIDYAAGGLTAAILVRSNAEVESICRWFREHDRSLPIMPLTDEGVGSASFLGELYQHFFRWLQHPGDAFREGLLCASPLHLLAESETSAAEAWQRWRARVDDSGLVAVLLRLTPQEAQRDRAFREWINAARQFDVSGGSLHEWVQYMEHLVSKSNPPKSYIHVMTYHKSKGAEYDVVFLPFAGSKSLTDPGKLAVHKCVDEQQQLGRVYGILTNPRVYDRGLPESPFYRMLVRWESEAMAEAMNLLYVAVTRAKRANYLFLNPNAHERSYSGVVEKALSGQCEWGYSDWHRRGDDKSELVGAAAPVQLEPAHSRRRQVSPSKIGAGHDMPAPQVPAVADAVEKEQVDAASFGTAVHALFEQVEWLGEGKEPAWLAEPRSEEERLVAAALRVPEVRALYTRRLGQAAYNEQNIDAVEDDKWISGTIDRLVLTVDEADKVQAAAIIDFKTDVRHGATPAEQDAHLRMTHLAQMRAYHSLIRQAFVLPPAAVSVTLISCPRDGAPARPVCYPTEALAGPA